MMKSSSILLLLLFLFLQSSLVLSQPQATKKYEVLVVNDDGVHSPGLDALVQLISTLGFVTNITVVAPAENESGEPDSTIPRADSNKQIMDQVNAIPSKTSPSGYPATALRNRHAADCVIWALSAGIKPDLVVSGINLGSNTGHVVCNSGTVAGARIAAARQIPAIAISHDGSTDDFTASTDMAKLYITDYYTRGFIQNSNKTVVSINVPRFVNNNEPVKTVTAESTNDDSYGSLPTDEEALDDGSIAVSIVTSDLDEMDC